jgi:hypothetical protein
LSNGAVEQIVTAQNPIDTNGVYFVLASADVNETSSFCIQYCGRHTHVTINGRDTKYVFVGIRPDVRVPAQPRSRRVRPMDRSTT